MTTTRFNPYGNPLAYSAATRRAMQHMERQVEQAQLRLPSFAGPSRLRELVRMNAYANALSALAEEHRQWEDFERFQSIAGQTARESSDLQLSQALDAPEPPPAASDGLDKLTADLTAFPTFNAMLDSSPNYRPTIMPRADDERYAALADAYDAAQLGRGDPRRAYRGRSAQHTVRLPREQAAGVLDFLKYNEDVLVDGGWDMAEAAMHALEESLT